jgi:hypothetical protein
MSIISCGATQFNRNIGLWDASKVNDMNGMTQFNDDIRGWNVSYMFREANQFKHKFDCHSYVGCPQYECFQFNAVIT